MTHEQLTRTPEQNLLELPFELAGDFVTWEEELKSTVAGAIEKEVLPQNSEYEESSENDRQVEATLRNLGAVSIIIVSAPEFANHAIRTETVKALTTRQPEQQGSEMMKENGISYAQDREEYAPYEAQAESIVRAALMGSESAYGQLSPEFAELLKVRVSSYDGVPAVQEYKGMISTVCIDLFRLSHGGKGADEVSQSDYGLAS